MLPPTLPPEVARQLVDPDEGFLCLSVHWRPKAGDPDPLMPGEKLSMASFVPVPPGEDCLCGSGESFRSCCQRKRQWYPICHNPGGEGYSLVARQLATFVDVDGVALRQRFAAERRLRCTDDSTDGGFWIYFGNPPVMDRYGALCFGDIELKQNRTLQVIAMSDQRMDVLLELLQEIAGDLLGTPELAKDPPLAMDKGGDQQKRRRMGRPKPRKPKPGRRRNKK